MGAGQGILRVTLVVPSNKSLTKDSDTSLVQKAVPAIADSSIANTAPGKVSAFSGEERYFLYHDVDKRSDFIYSEPLVQLEKIIVADVEVKLTVKILISEEGLVDTVTVLDAVPSAIYNEEVVKALLQSRFSPAEKGGRKVKSQKILEIKFAAKGVVS